MEFRLESGRVAVYEMSSWHSRDGWQWDFTFVGYAH